MPTTPSAPTWDAMALAQQLQAIASQSQKLMQRFLSRQQDWGQVGMGDASAIGGAFVELMTKMASDPSTVAAAQIDLFNNSVRVWQEATNRMLKHSLTDPLGPHHKRFKHADWTENAMFNFIKESYLVAAKSVLSSVQWCKG